MATWPDQPPLTSVSLRYVPADEPHKQLSDVMDERRLAMGLSWKVVAERARVSAEALRAIRRGDYRPSALTARGLEDVLELPHGTIHSILDGVDLAEAPTHEQLDAEMSDLERLVDELDERLQVRLHGRRDRERRAVMEIIRSLAEEPNDQPA